MLAWGTCCRFPPFPAIAEVEELTGDHTSCLDSPWLWHPVLLPRDFHHCRCPRPGRLHAVLVLAASRFWLPWPHHQEEVPRRIRSDRVDTAEIWYRDGLVFESLDVGIVVRNHCVTNILIDNLQTHHPVLIHGGGAFGSSADHQGVDGS